MASLPIRSEYRNVVFLRKLLVLPPGLGPFMTAFKAATEIAEKLMDGAGKGFGV